MAGERRLGALWGPSGDRMGAILDHSWAPIGAIMGHLGAVRGRLGAILGRLGLFLEASWSRGALGDSRPGHPLTFHLAYLAISLAN